MPHEKIPRRRMLYMMLGSTCYAAQAGPLKSATTHALHVHQRIEVAAGLKPSAGSAIFNKHQMNTIAALSEIIIPTDSHSPGAKSARVHEFINEVVSVSNKELQELWVDGLAALDKMARREYGGQFADCTTNQQIGLLTIVAQNEREPVTLEERFFVALKQATIDGYYLSDVGIHQELQYQGNAVLTEFPGCTHEDHKSEQR